MDLGKLFLKVVHVAKDLFDGAQKDAQTTQHTQTRQQPQPAPSNVSPAVEIERTAAEWEAYFKEILLNEFPEYTIRENVPVSDLAGFASDEFQLYKTRPYQVYKAEWGQPYTFVLEKDSRAMAVVMLGNGHSHDSNVKYLIARMYAKKLGLPYINFYTQMANERGYVIERIRMFMN